jgi:hypothetical protein
MNKTRNHSIYSGSYITGSNEMVRRLMQVKVFFFIVAYQLGFEFVQPHAKFLVTKNFEQYNRCNEIQHSGFP